MSRDLHILARPHPGEQTFIGSVIGILHANSWDIYKFALSLYNDYIHKYPVCIV